MNELKLFDSSLVGFTVVLLSVSLQLVVCRFLAYIEFHFIIFLQLPELVRCCGEERVAIWLIQYYLY